MNEYKNVIEWHLLREEIEDRKERTANDNPTSSRAVTNCCANCVEPSAPSNGDPIYRILGKPAMRLRWMAGANPHKSG